MYLGSLLTFDLCCCHHKLKNTSRRQYFGHYLCFDKASWLLVTYGNRNSIQKSFNNFGKNVNKNVGLIGKGGESLSQCAIFIDIY